MKKKLTTRIAAFAAAGVLAIAMAPMAAFGVGALTADTTLTVSGLDNGDKVSFYKIVEQADAEHGSGWKFVDELDADGDGTLDDSNPEIKIEDLAAFANKTAYDDSKVITGSMADQIAALASSKGVSAAKADMTAAEGKVEYDLSEGLGADDPTPVGLYMAIVTDPAKTDTVYKPIFVSADYDQGAATATVAQHDNTNSIAITETKEDTDGTGYKDDPSNGVFKKSKLTLMKEAGDEDDRLMDAAVGQVIPFTVTTNMPSYTQNFEGPVFKITDELTAGLELCNQDGTAAGTKEDITVEVAGYTSANLVADKDYKVTVTGNNKWVVEFANDADGQGSDKDGILYTVKGNPQVTITYYAKVTDASKAAQVNQMDNTVKLDFTNAPDDTEGAGTLKDRTRHYTFGLDANIMGNGTGPDGKETTSEIRKIAVDANGDPIYKKTTSALETDITSDNPDVYKWLEGAKFKLEQTHKYVDADEAGYGDKTGDEAFVAITKTEIKFDAKDIAVANGGNRPESDGSGYIAMKGLDAGIYELTEVEAPLGYSFDPSIVYKITITPTFTNDNETDDTFTDVPNKILSGYTVGIVAMKSTTELANTLTKYTTETAGDPATPVSFINEGDNETGGITITETDATTAETALIVNKELGILPATGGSGILFYLGLGAGIMVLAVALGVMWRRRTRRNVSAQA